MSALQLDLFGAHDPWSDAADFLATHSIGMRVLVDGGLEPTVEDVRALPPYMRYYIPCNAYFDEVRRG